MKKLLPNLFTTLISILVLCSVLEAFVRGFVDRSIYTFTPALEDWTGDRLLGWKNKGNYQDQSFRYGEVIRYETNVDGFRPASVQREKPANTLRIMLVGNSTVAARDLPESNSLHYYLDSLLDLSGYSFEVVNAGVLGYATDQALLTIEKYINLYSPDVVCYGYCINDLYANLNQEYSGLHKPSYQSRLDSLLLVPPAKSNEGIHHLESGTFISLLQRSALYGLLRPSLQKIRMAISKQAELDQGGMKDLKIYTRLTCETNEWMLFSQLVAKMNATCLSNCSKFYFYAHPEVVSVWPPYREAIGKSAIPPHIFENKLQEISQETGAPFIPMVDHFLQNQDRGPFHLLPRDPHCNGVGYLMQAEVLAAGILQNITHFPISFN